MAHTCSHLDQIRITATDQSGCEECLRTGDTWVHLRMCLSCGHVGCCDSSRNRHATRHYESHHHPLVTSLEAGESWVWCYPDEMIVGELERSDR